MQRDGKKDLRSIVVRVEALRAKYRAAHTPSSVRPSSSSVCPPARIARHMLQPLRDVRDVTPSSALVTAIHPSNPKLFPLERIASRE